jgi:hypothetical protein
MNKLLTVLVLGILCFSACKMDVGEKLYPNPVACDTANVKYASTVQPIIQVNCLNQGCHTAGNPNGGFSFDTYNNFKVVIENGKLIPALKYLTGGSKNMPPNNAKLNDCDINKIDAWVKSGYPEN